MNWRGRKEIDNTQSKINKLKVGDRYRAGELFDLMMALHTSSTNLKLQGYLSSDGLFVILVVLIICVHVVEAYVYTTLQKSMYWEVGLSQDTGSWGRSCICCEEQVLEDLSVVFYVVLSSCCVLRSFFSTGPFCYFYLEASWLWTELYKILNQSKPFLL